MVASLRISPGLLAQLKGDASGGAQSGVGPTSTSSQVKYPINEFFPQFNRFDPQTQAAIDKSRELRSALTTSESVGGLLLKQEENEMEKIQSKASQLLGSNLGAEQRQPPCSSERASVIDCYKQNPGNELRCSRFVQAYQACSDEAFKASLA